MIKDLIIIMYAIKRCLSYCDFQAWIRLALNDGLIESYLDAILSDHTKLQ